MIKRLLSVSRLLLILLACAAGLGLALLWVPAWRDGLGALLLVTMLLAPAVWAVQGLVRAQWRAARSQDQTAAWVRFMALHCPRCGQQAMPLLRKWDLGWSGQGTCQHCGQRVQNDGLPPFMLAGPPVLGVLVAALLAGAVRELDAQTCVTVLGLLGVLCSLVLAVWRPFLRLEEPPVAASHGTDDAPPGDAGPR